MGNVDFLETLSEAFGKFQISGGFPEEASSKLLVPAIIFAVLALACCIIVAIADKSCRGMGIVAGIFNLGSLILTPTYIKFFHNTPFFKVEYIYGSSQEEVDKLVDEFYANYFAETLPGMILSSIASIVTLLAFVFTIILIIKCMKVLKPKLLATFGLIILIIRYLAINPIDLLSPFTKGAASLEGQVSQAIVYYVSVLIPLLMVAIAGIVTLANGKKPLKPISVVAEETVAEEATQEAAE